MPKRTGVTQVEVIGMSQIGQMRLRFAAKMLVTRLGAKVVRVPQVRDSGSDLIRLHLCPTDRADG
jgi:hypothetical protein